MNDMNDSLEPVDDGLPSPVPNSGSKEPTPADEADSPRAAAFDERPCDAFSPSAGAREYGGADPFADHAGDELADELGGELRGGGGIDRILEIPLVIHVELGRKRLRIRDLLELGTGSVLTLSAQAGAPLSIYANKTLIAEGEAVVVGERYGVRVTDIVSPAERVKRLGGED